MRVVVWTALGRRYAIDVAHVVEVVPVVASRRLDGVGAWVRGLMDYRERLVPLLDACVLLAGVTGEPRRSWRVLVLRLDPADAGSLVGLLVQRVDGVEAIEFSDAAAHPGLETAETTHLGPVARVGEATVQLLEPARMLSADQRAALFARGGSTTS